MINRKTFPKVLILLAAFVLFSANTVYFLEAGEAEAGYPLRKNYHFDFDNVRKKTPYLNLKAALLINYDNGEVLYSKNSDVVRSIASISKLVSAMVVIDKRVDLDQVVAITREDARRARRSRVRVGYELTVRDLLHAALMNSDNRATKALARVTSGSVEQFVKEMNRKVRTMGLEQTIFYDPTGLDSRNVSTAHEVAKILHYAVDYKLIADITARKKYRAKICNRKNTYRQFANTNRLVLSPYKVLSGKTGYTVASDYCLTTLVQNREGQRLTLVVLGVPGDKLRFREARRLLNWGFRNVS